MEALARFRSIVRARRLIYQFWIAAAVTIFVSMAVLTYAVSSRVQAIAMQTAADEGAVLVATFLGPEVQELANRRELSPETTRRLDELLQTRLGDRLKVIKIWLRDGTLVYATNSKLVGQKFPSPHLDNAFAGRVSGSFDELDDLENRFDRELRIPLIEIYAPFYRTGTQDVIAVGEIYNDASRLAAELSNIRRTTASLVGMVIVPMMLVLFLIVRRAEAAVARNRASLSRKVIEARHLALQNDQLRRDANEARLEAIESNEQLLGRIGQDLHDGPIQMLSVLMLRLSDLHPATNPPDGTPSPVSIVADLASQSLSELRDISTGLVLPHLEGLTARETLLLAINQHIGMTATQVEHDIEELSFYPAAPLRTCLFRVVQEGLNNAYYYARGVGQQVTARLQDQRIVITVSDRGGDVGGARPAALRRTGLGLAGLRRRANNLGGTLEIVREAHGTRLQVSLPIAVPGGALQD